MRLLNPIILAIFFAATISSCAGQGKTQTKNKDFEQNAVGTIVRELALNSNVIYQDKIDNYWLENEIGLYQYNGKTLILFTQKDGLVNHRIIGIQEDQLGNIYFDTPSGVSKFDGKQFTTLEVIEDHPNKNTWKSEEDDLWFRIGWDKKGPYKFDGEHLFHLEFPESKIAEAHFAKYPNISYNPYSIYSMYKDRKGHMWFGTADLGIYQFDGKQIRWMHEDHLGTMPGGGAFGIRSIVEDNDGHIRISNTNYKYKILPDRKDDDSELISLNYQKESGINYKNNEVLYFMSMLVDDNGNLWGANLDGIWINDGIELRQFFITDGDKAISPSSIYIDHQGDIWLGTESDGIYKYNGVSSKKVRFN